MKTIFKYILVITLIVALTACSTTKENPSTLAQLYNLDEDLELEKVLLLEYQEINLLDSDWRPSGQETEHEVDVKKIKPFYDYIMDLEVEEVESKQNIELESFESYRITFKFDNDERSILIIDLGESYIIVNGDKSSNGLFMHDLSEEVYSELILLLGSCIEYL